MIYLETKYFILSKTLLRVVDLWPYQQSKLIRFQFIFILAIFATIIIFQLTTFMTSKCTPNFVIKILSSELFFMIILTKYILFRVHINTMKDLLTQLQDKCNEITEANEIAIIEKYGYNARCYTTVFTTFILSCTSITIIGQFLPSIFNIVLSRNESRLHSLQIAMEYLIDKEKYFYLILFHFEVAILIGIIALVAIGTMFIAYFQYICGMFMIASYRIEYAMENHKLQDINVKNENFILIGIIRAVEIHRQAMKLCDLLRYKFETMFFFLIVFGVTCLSFNLLRTMSSGDAKEFILSVVLAIICILYMFVANYVGQEITDHNNYIYAAAYNVQWYRAPVHIQKLILFLLQRGVKNFTLTIGGVFNASNEYFTMLVKASVSYFAVIYSTR